MAFWVVGLWRIPSSVTMGITIKMFLVYIHGKDDIQIRPFPSRHVRPALVTVRKEA
jgi:hypothetical protein